MTSPTGRQPPEHRFSIHQFPVRGTGKSRFLQSLQQERMEYLAEQRRVAQIGIKHAVAAFLASFRR